MSLSFFCVYTHATNLIICVQLGVYFAYRASKSVSILYHTQAAKINNCYETTIKQLSKQYTCINGQFKYG